jgi:hypothetical protein
MSETGEPNRAEARDEAPAPTAGPETPLPWFRRLWVHHVGVFVLYLSVSLLLFGPKILSEMSTRILSSAPAESSVFVWSFAWWPHAIGHGLNPLFTHLAWAPTGLNLAWSATVPTISVPLAPLTLIFGPVVTFNVATLLAPAVSAWTAYLLCRHLARALWPAAMGGAVFGFSPDLLSELKTGHLNLSMLFVIPLCVYLVVVRLEGSMSPRRFVVLLTCALIAEFGIFIETFATLTLVGGIVGVVLFLLSPRERRPLLIRTAGMIALAYGLTMVAVSPYLYAMFAYPQALKPATFRGIAQGLTRTKDLLLFIVPGHNLWIGSSVGQSSDGKNPWYLGLVLVAILVHLWISGRRRLLVKVLAIGFLIAFLFALGPVVRVGGVRTPLPWRAVQLLPFLARARPGRIVAFAYLFAAVSMAVWLARARIQAARWGLAGLAVVLLIPNLAATWTKDVSVPSFFTTGQYREYLAPGETVMVVGGTRGTEMYWQAEGDFSFGLARWYYGFFPPGYAYGRAGQRFEVGNVRAGDASTLRAFVSAHQVRAIIFADVKPSAISLMSSMLGVAPVQVGGVALLRLR